MICLWVKQRHDNLQYIIGKVLLRMSYSGQNRMEEE